MVTKTIHWPAGKRFAFSIFDDTDEETVGNAGPVYAFLQKNGLLTTKSVWPLSPRHPPYIGGATCANPAYLAWVQTLQRDGFEIGYHMATAHTSPRAETLLALQTFREMFGHWPHTMANHADCEENIYWGDYRVSGPYRLFYNLLTKSHNKNKYRGHVENQSLFWGDICQQHITYVRNFVYKECNTLKACPLMPYHDPTRPYVNFWFASSEGANVESFNHTLCEANQDRLEAEGGACIMYTHFASGFCQDGHLHKRFAMLIKRLAQKQGWFVPVATLLNYLRRHNGDHTLSHRQRRALETKWLWQKIRSGTS